MGISDPSQYFPMEKALNKDLDIDFKDIVAKINQTLRGFYFLVDAPIYAYIKKWADVKFIKHSHLFLYKKFPNGGIYLELLLAKLFRKQKTFSGVFVDDYTDY